MKWHHPNARCITIEPFSLVFLPEPCLLLNCVFTFNLTRQSRYYEAKEMKEKTKVPGD